MPLSKATRRAILRWLFLTHRWVGIVTCLFFAMWFASGLVMLFVPYPALSPAARWQGATAIDWTRVDVAPPLAPGAAGLVLEMRGAEPVWRIEQADGTIRTRAARRAATLAPVDGRLARQAAAAFAGTSVRSTERLMRDQWTVAGGFDRHRPLWKVSLADPAGTVLYVSSATGLPVQRTTTSQRMWNWLGSVPHWLYPTILRQDQPLWRQVVLWVAGPGIAVALTGLWIGILRARFGQRRYRAGRISPYHGWMLWHHVSGLVGGLFLLSWIVSGWLSVDPGRLFAGTTTAPAALARYRALTMAPGLTLARLAATAPQARTVEIIGSAGQMRVVIDRASDRARILDAATLAAPHGGDRMWDHATGALVPDGRLWQVDRLGERDAYWPATATLPVLRQRFDDPSRTWLYVDPATGEVLARQDRARRLYRWVLDLLHCCDWPWLIERRVLHDGMILILSAFGLILSVSGIRLGYRRVMKRA